MSEAEFEQQVDEIFRQSKKRSHEAFLDELPKPIRLAPASPPFFFGPLEALDAAQAGTLAVDAAIVCQDPKTISTTELIARGECDSVNPGPAAPKKRPILTLLCPPGKLGSRALRDELARIATFLKSHFSHTAQPRLLFASSPGLDLAVPVALTVACLHLDDSGRFVVEGIGDEERKNRNGKAFVRMRLVHILGELGLETSGLAEGNGVRGTSLRAVNEFVMGQKPGRKKTSRAKTNGEWEEPEIMRKSAGDGNI
jgi:hypothetical protein